MTTDLLPPTCKWDIYAGKVSLKHTHEVTSSRTLPMHAFKDFPAWIYTRSECGFHFSCEIHHIHKPWSCWLFQSYTGNCSKTSLLMYVCAFVFHASHIGPLTEMNVDVQSFSFVLGQHFLCVFQSLLLNFHQDCMLCVSSSKPGPNEGFFFSPGLPIRLVC